MASDPRIAALPAVIALAEEQAREELSALFIVAANFNIFGPSLVAVHVALLSDLSRPASGDAVARLVAEKARIHLWAIHLILLGGTDYPPEWPASLTDALAAATEREALTLIALHALGATHG